MTTLRERAEKIAKRLDDEVVSFAPSTSDFTPPVAEQIRVGAIATAADLLERELEDVRKEVLREALAQFTWLHGGHFVEWLHEQTGE